VDKVRRVRDGAEHEVSQDAGHWESMRRPWEGAFGVRARRARGARRPARPCVTAFLFERLKLQKLNRSAQSGE
jgi:hypothetical protein